MYHKIVISIASLMVTACSFAADKPAKESRMCSALSLVMSSETLAPYYHVETFPERLPIKVLFNSGNTKCTEISLFDKPVLFLDESMKESLEFFNVTFKWADEIAIIDLSFDPEGISGLFKLEESKDGSWKILSEKITEK